MTAAVALTVPLGPLAEAFVVRPPATPAAFSGPTTPAARALQRTTQSVWGRRSAALSVQLPKWGGREEKQGQAVTAVEEGGKEKEEGEMSIGQMLKNYGGMLVNHTPESERGRRRGDPFLSRPGVYVAGACTTPPPS